MRNTVEATLKHVEFLNRHLNTCDLQCMIVVVLLELGIPTKRSGFDYLKNAILLLCEDPARLITKGVYPVVGELYNPPIGDLQVEQAIRSAIKEAWKDRNERVWDNFFPYDKSGEVKKPTNAEFITRIARILELWQGCRKEVSYERE